MITNRAVLGAVSDKWETTGLFDDRWSNLIGGWCVKHYLKYGSAPGRQIETYFDRWTDTREGRDRSVVKLVEKFLTSLSAEYSRGKKLQVAHTIDLAGEYFTRVKVSNLKERLEILLEDGKIQEAVEAANGFNRVEVGRDSTVNVLQDKEAIRKAFESKSDPLITYPGALGIFFEDSLEREGFISVEGPEKRGKTGWLLEFGWQGMSLGRRVAFFEVGDLSQDQIMRRFMVRAAGRPMKPTREGVPILVPTNLYPPNDPKEPATVLHEEKTYSKPLSWQKAYKASQKLVGKTGEDLLRLQTYPANSITVAGINAALDRWARDGWIADIVIIDYIDLLAPSNGKEDTRIQIGRTWRELSKLRQARRCLVLGATQTSAESYDAELITMKHFSENKLKRAEVTGSFALNQNDTEKKLGLFRFNWLVGREWAYDSKAVVHVAGCAALMKPAMFSTFGPAEDKKRGRRK